MPASSQMLLATVCAMAVGGVPLTRALGINHTDGQQGRAVSIPGTQGTPSSALPRLFVLGIRLVHGVSACGVGGFHDAGPSGLIRSTCVHDESLLAIKGRRYRLRDSSAFAEALVTTDDAALQAALTETPAAARSAGRTEVTQMGCSKRSVWPRIQCRTGQTAPKTNALPNNSPRPTTPKPTQNRPRPQHHSPARRAAPRRHQSREHPRPRCRQAAQGTLRVPHTCHTPGCPRGSHGHSRTSRRR